MGYTHYWDGSGLRAPLAPEAMAQIRKVTDEAYRLGLIQREYDDPRPPLVTAQVVRFNGVGELGHDTFGFCTTDTYPFGACKTALKPYDAIVMRVLLILAYYCPGLKISSDGAFDNEWQPALDWFEEQGIGGVCVDQRLKFYRPAGNGRLAFDHEA